ncbi:hypothetical protein [Adhaeribacter rhizoryzae]|uniref:Uncharacterized protein n=1 Tax=Adhaeribacter rhizoryzae TaxID=2607907 RepID=A0A5M6D5Y0_9BACT|nr:hypothetical protein [Adhaeribacter rhizoryzae]KAA5542917.1 hypothetical protein F0145_17390 [Adhaeribacter rhizoryzae]
MSTLEEYKRIWEQKENAGANQGTITQASLVKIIRNRVQQHTKSALNYFWASFTLQLIVYALLGHVMVKYGQSSRILYLAIAGILLYIPFTIVLLRKFKKLVTEKPVLQSNIDTSLYNYVFGQQALLRSFYHFKKLYEFLLIPSSCAIGVFLVFALYVPGGVHQHWWGAIITFLLSLASCIAAIYAENKKSFILPIKQLQTILDEFEQKD